MNQSKHEFIALARYAQDAISPFRELEELHARLVGREKRTVHEAAVERILMAVARLAREHAWASEMQLGAEGYDNKGSAAAYHDAQIYLAQAAKEVARTCERLLAQDP